jgi:serine/threonine-protein kinase
MACEATGSRVFSQLGAYRIVRQIGEGGMGAVFEGVHAGNGQRVAIKVLLPHFSQQPEVVARFFNEARAVVAIDHPSIVKVFDVGQLPDGTTYMVMEFLEGETLAGRMKRLGGGGMGPRAIAICREVAQALVEAHRRGIIHRDLKPDNVMLIPDGRGGEIVKVLDFGIAKIAADAELGPNKAAAVRTKTGMVLGTPYYMSPEQCRGLSGISGKTDVYALGAVMYHLLAGRPPFVGQGVGEILAMQIYETPKSLVEVVPSVPAPVSQLVARMLDKSPEARPNMGDVARALGSLETGQYPTILATPQGGATTMRSAASAVERRSAGGEQRRRGKTGGSRALVAVGLTLVMAGVGTGAALLLFAKDSATKGPVGGGPTTESPPAGVRGAAGKVIVIVKTDPSGAEVVRASDGTVLGKTPWVSEQDRADDALDVILRKAGFAEKKVSLTRAKDVTMRWLLEPLPSAPTTAPSGSKKHKAKDDDLDVKPLD